MTEPRYTTIQGQRVLVVPRPAGLPQKLDALLAAMANFGFARLQVDRPHRRHAGPRSRHAAARRDGFHPAHRLAPERDGIARRRHAGERAKENELNMVLHTDCTTCRHPFGAPFYAEASNSKPPLYATASNIRFPR